MTRHERLKRVRRHLEATSEDLRQWTTDGATRNEVALLAALLDLREAVSTLVYEMEERG